jgi:ankyrin repeat protein
MTTLTLSPSLKRFAVRALILRFAPFAAALLFSLGLVVVYMTYEQRQYVFDSAASTGNLTTMRVMYALGVDVDGSDGFPPIVGAASAGQNQAVEYLLDRGANINARRRGGWTPLMTASNFGRTKTVKLLISHNADINAERGDETALSLAKQSVRIDVVEILRQAGAKEQ